MDNDQKIQPKESKTPTDQKSVMENAIVNQNQGDQYILQKQTADNTKEIERLKTELSGERFNNLTIFGIFASLVTFFSVEIQVFKNIDNFWLIIGLTSFLISSMLLFIFAVHAIARDKLSWRNFFASPIFADRVSMSSALFIVLTSFSDS